MAKESELFQRWLGFDAVGKAASPIELMVLGALRYLGRGWTFDDLEESTAITEETHREFFHVLIEWGQTFLFDRYVVFPANAEEAETHMHEMKLAGFDGAVGSTEATHIGMEWCSYRVTNIHSGAKLPMPSRTYNMTVNHRRQILSTTRGRPARWNDKTLVLFDEFATYMYEGYVLSEVEFDLFEYDEDGKIKSVRYKGVWLMVDNGYLRWPTTVPPFKEPITFEGMRFSLWLESVRKDVECTFGILKGRFRLLKTGVRVHGVEATDKIWLTCCALHNFLLKADGLNTQWDDGVPSDLEGDLGLHSELDAANHVPFAIRRLLQTDELEGYDTSGMGPGHDRNSSM
jgi:hypothetical protein